MIELNKKYSSKELAEALGTGYNNLRRYREEYEEHLAKFYDCDKEYKGNAVYYIFKEQLFNYIPFKEYRRLQKSELLQKHIEETIAKNNRQTGSNIARIIRVNGEIQALNYKLSTLTVYVRDELRTLAEQKHYELVDYAWCYLNKAENKYVLMPEEDIKILRSYFKNEKIEELEENMLSAAEQGTIAKEYCEKSIVELRKGNFIQGRKNFSNNYGYWPMKVPVYERKRF